MLIGSTISIPGQTVSLPAPFNGQFASLFPGAYQVLQTDLGLTYGGTMLASGTAPPVITLMGTLVGPPVPIRVECTVLGALGVWQGRIAARRLLLPRAPLRNRDAAQVNVPLVNGLANRALYGSNGFTATLFTSALNTLRQYCGSNGNQLAFSSTAPTRFVSTFTNSIADVLQAGASSTTGVSSGTAIPSGVGPIEIGSERSLAYYGNVEIFGFFIVPPTSLSAFDAALNSAGGYGPGSVAV